MKKSEVKTLLVLTGFTCNNNCLVCSVGEKRCAFPDREFAEIENDLKNGRLDNFTEVEFTGGETTIRKDITDLVRRAKELGYTKVSLSTNGRLFSYNDFTKKIIKAGLDKVTFSLLGSSDEVHNAVTRTPGSFKEILQGIKNVKEFKEVEVKVSTVLSRINFQNVDSLAKLIISLGVRHWYLLDLIPDGNAEKNYQGLVVELGKIGREISKLKSRVDNFAELGFFDFPFCIFAKEMRELKATIFVNTRKRGETAEQIGYNPDRIILDNKGDYIDKHKTHVKICGQCRYHDECGGVWKDYLKLFDEKEIFNLAKENNCLKK